MTVRLLEIETNGRPPAAGAAGRSSFEVRVLVDLDGRTGWYAVHVRPRVLPRFDATLLQPGDDLQDLLQHDQYALHRICRLVGQSLRGLVVQLPEQVAA